MENVEKENFLSVVNKKEENSTMKILEQVIDEENDNMCQSIVTSEEISVSVIENTVPLVENEAVELESNIEIKTSFINEEKTAMSQNVVVSDENSISNESTVELIETLSEFESNTVNNESPSSYSNTKLEDKTINEEKSNICQTVVTSQELQEQQSDEATFKNVLATNSLNPLATKFSEVFEISSNYEVHPFAKIFPDATPLEFRRLLSDIEVHGQYEPIIIFEGKIADGRTRKQVQDTLKKPTLAREWLGEPEELLNYLFTKTQQRQLTSQQIAVISLEFVDAERELAKKRQGMRTDIQQITNANKEKEKGRALDLVAKKMKTNRTYISQAEFIQNKAPELLDLVKNDELSLNNAHLLAKKLPKLGRETALKEYKDNKRKISVIVDEILNGKDKEQKPQEISENNLHLFSSIKIKDSVVEEIVEEIKDILHKHDYIKNPLKILVMKNGKEEMQVIDTLIKGGDVSITVYEVVPEVVETI